MINWIMWMIYFTRFMFVFSFKFIKDEKLFYICVSCGELDCKYRYKVYRFCYFKEYIIKVCRKIGGYLV